MTRRLRDPLRVIRDGAPDGWAEPIAAWKPAARDPEDQTSFRHSPRRRHTEAVSHVFKANNVPRSDSKRHLTSTCESSRILVCLRRTQASGRVFERVTGPYEGLAKSGRWGRPIRHQTMTLFLERSRIDPPRRLSGPDVCQPYSAIEMNRLGAVPASEGGEKSPSSRRGPVDDCGHRKPQGRAPPLKVADTRRHVPDHRLRCGRDDSWGYRCFARRQRVCIARRAISWRRCDVSALARAGPPLRPPSRPSATACGSLGRSLSRITAMRSVGAPHVEQGGPITSVRVGSWASCSASHTRHRRRTSRIVGGLSFIHTTILDQSRMCKIPDTAGTRVYGPATTDSGTCWQRGRHSRPVGDGTRRRPGAYLST